MAMAGAERIFALMDEEIERDEGKVTLTRYREEEGKHRRDDGIHRQMGVASSAGKR